MTLTPGKPKGASIGRNTKYVSRNPVSRYLLANYFQTLEHLLGDAPDVLLEVGCGEGVLLHTLRDKFTTSRSVALDIDRPDLRAARQNLPETEIIEGSVYALPFSENRFDLVICCEVLEHLENPEAALKEISRVGADRFIFSVPNEPLWRCLNVLRGAYLGQGGNPPGHINHWSAKAFTALLEKHFRVDNFTKPLPWLMALCRKP